MKLETLQVLPKTDKPLRELMYTVQRNFERLQQYVNGVTVGSAVTALIEVRTTGSYSLPLSTGSKVGYYIKNTGSSLIVSPAGSDTIDGGGAFTMTFQHQSQLFIDGVSGSWDVF